MGNGASEEPQRSRTEAGSEKASGTLTRIAEALRGYPFRAGVLPMLAAYLVSRLLLLGRLPIFFDESIFIRWSQLALCDGSFLASLTDGKLPLHRWLMVPFIAVFKDPLIGGRVSAVMCGAATLVLLILLGRELSGWKLGLWAGLFYLVCPFCLWYDRVAITEGLLLTVFVLSALVAVISARKLSIGYALLLALALGLAMLTKGTAQLLFLITPFAYLSRPRRARAEHKHPLLRWVLMLAVSYLLAYGIYSLLRFSDLFYRISSRTGVATKSLGEVLSNPFDVFFSNAATIFTTLLLFVTPVLVGIALIGLGLGLVKRKRFTLFLVIWLLVTWVVEALISKHWMFDTILPRFFLVLLPPLLLGAACAMVQGQRAIQGKEAPGWMSSRAVIALALVFILAFPVCTEVLIIGAPQRAPLPYWIRYQYITGWPSGWGMKEIVDFIEHESEQGEVTVGSNLDGPADGLPTDGLELYLSGNSDVDIVPFSYTEKEFPDELERASKRGPTYIAYNMFSKADFPPRNWPVEVLQSFPKDGNDEMRMFLLKVAD